MIDFACFGWPHAITLYLCRNRGKKPMKKTLMVVGFIVLVCLLAIWPITARAQGGFELVAGDAFNRAVPADFYLEGNHIPVEKRNAALLKDGKGARLVWPSSTLRATVRKSSRNMWAC